MRESDPAARRGETLAAALTRVERAIPRLVDAYQDEQITLDELRARMPELRRRESTLRAERDVIAAEIDDAANYLSSPRPSRASPAALAGPRSSVHVL